MQKLFTFSHNAATILQSGQWNGLDRGRYIPRRVIRYTAKLPSQWPPS